MSENQPYAIVGAGPLVSQVHKRLVADDVWRYEFNIFRMDERGQVDMRYGPEHLGDLLKLSQVLAFTLSDDGCVSPQLRAELSRLATELDAITRQD